MAMKVRINYAGNGSTLAIDSREVVVKGGEGDSHLFVEFLDLCPHIVKGTDSIGVSVDPNRGGVCLRVEQREWLIVVSRETHHSGSPGFKPYVVTRSPKTGGITEYMNLEGEWMPRNGWGELPADAMRVPLPF